MTGRQIPGIRVVVDGVDQSHDSMRRIVRRNLHRAAIGRALKGDIRTSVVVTTDAEGLDVAAIVTVDQWRQNSHKLPDVFGWRDGGPIVHVPGPSPFTVVASGTATLADDGQLAVDFGPERCPTCGQPDNCGDCTHAV